MRDVRPDTVLLDIYVFCPRDFAGVAYSGYCTLLLEKWGSRKNHENAEPITKHTLLLRSWLSAVISHPTAHIYKRWTGKLKWLKEAADSLIMRCGDAICRHLQLAYDVARSK